VRIARVVVLARLAVTEVVWSVDTSLQTWRNLPLTGSCCGGSGARTIVAYATPREARYVRNRYSISSQT
jgi:hypothetical protein